MRLPTDQKWDQLFEGLGIKDFVDFIASPAIQDALLPIKIVFALFAAFFFCAVIYFYMNSSYLRYQFLQDASEFFSWQAYGLKEVNRRWKKILKKVSSGSEKDYKLAILEAEDYLKDELQDADIKGAKFEELVENAGRKMLPNWQEILESHKVRDAIAHDINYKLDIALAKKMLVDYEKAIRSIYSY